MKSSKNKHCIIIFFKYFYIVVEGNYNALYRNYENLIKKKLEEKKLILV